jgi:hypothetical protein
MTRAMPRSRLLRSALAGLAAAGALSACSQQLQAPGDAGVCWHMVTLASGAMKFNKVSAHEPNIENCASSLDGMRMRFMALGGPQEITGAYQGNFLFLTPQGIYMAQQLDGFRYLLLVRAGDKLVRPSELPTQ